MKKPLSLPGIAIALICISLNTFAQQSGGQLITANDKTFDGEKFQFPTDMKGQPVNVVFLAISDSQEGGERQQQELLAWQASIDESGGLPEGVLAYHFPVLEDSFFLPSGIIRKAMAKSYKDKVPPSQSGVLFIKSVDKFVKSAGIELDDQATVIIANPEGKVLAQFKGTVSDAKLSALREALGSVM